MNVRALASSLLLIACASSSVTLAQVGHVQVIKAPVAIEDFLLTDQEGRPFHFSDLRGRSALVFFGFTHCPGVCPTTMFKLRELVHREELRRSVVPEVVMISVDGERDAPAVMKSYLAPLSPRFIGLTGRPQDVRRIARKFSAVFFKGLPGDDSGNYQVDHTAQVYFVDGEGRLRVVFSGASIDEMTAAIEDALVTSNRQG